jgi:hypothetical protein
VNKIKERIVEYGVKTEEEQRTSQLGDLYDQYKLSEAYLNETIELLTIITGNKHDLPPIGETLNEISLKMMSLSEAVEKAFKVGGLAYAGSNKEE